MLASIHVLQPLGVCMYLTCPDAGTLLSPLHCYDLCVYVYVVCVCVCACVIVFCANVYATSCF